MRAILNEVGNYAYTAYIRCPLARSAYKVMARNLSVCADINQRLHMLEACWWWESANRRSWWFQLPRWWCGQRHTLLLILSLLDYLTTIYCLGNIPNCYETNPFLKTSDLMFKFKILLGVPAGIAGILVGFALDKFRIKYKTKLVNLGYFVLFTILFALLIKSCLVVSNKLIRFSGTVSFWSCCLPLFSWSALFFSYSFSNFSKNPELIAGFKQLFVLEPLSKFQQLLQSTILKWLKLVLLNLHRNGEKLTGNTFSNNFVSEPSKEASEIYNEEVAIA